MIDIKFATEEFDKYTKNYDLTNEKLKRKYNHTYRVMQISEDIAKSINLNQEEVNLAKIIGLLHDIARFEQYKRFSTFSDSISVDHGDLGVEILTKNNYIRKFLKDDKYDNIILKSIKNHNKYKIEENLTKEELLFSKIIRDADKLDIFYETCTYFYKKENEIQEIENGVIEENTIKQINEKKLLKKMSPSNTIYRLLINLAFVFDYNFKYSYEVMYKKDYINKTIDRFDFKNKETKKHIEEIRIILNEYIKEKIKDDKI